MLMKSIPYWREGYCVSGLHVVVYLAMFSVLRPKMHKVDESSLLRNIRELS